MEYDGNNADTLKGQFEQCHFCVLWLSEGIQDGRHFSGREKASKT